jgi:N-acetylneuraminic acid mutarotase
MCCIGDYIYIFGGYCRSEFYSSLTKVHTQLNSAKTEEALPNGRAFHNMVTYGNKIIVFGGHSATVLQDYYSFNVTEEKWAAVPHISGKYPVKKEKQTCVIYEMLLVFFGGYFCSPDFEYEEFYKDISVLDIENMKWIDQIEVEGDQPTGRFAHAAALVGSEMFVFGGTYNTAKYVLVDLA